MADNQISKTPWGDPDADPEHVRAYAATRGGPEYGELLDAQRLLNDRLAGAALPPDVAAKVTAQLRDVVDTLADHQTAETGRYDGMRPDLPGRGHPLLPPYVIEHSRQGQVRGQVTFTRLHLGGNDAVHGGALPLLFDDVLGRVANAEQEGIARTAFLKVNYRVVTPIDVELTFDGTQDRVEGRKRFATGRLYGPDGTLLADAESLFLRLLPGQP